VAGAVASLTTAVQPPPPLLRGTATRLSRASHRTAVRQPTSELVLVLREIAAASCATGRCWLSLRSAVCGLRRRVAVGESPVKAGFCAEGAADVEDSVGCADRAAS
jgi:hypothetical protein